MDELQEAFHKFERECAHLSRMMEDDPHIELALAQAKRVRAASTILVRALAQERDQATALEGTSDEYSNR